MISQVFRKKRFGNLRIARTLYGPRILTFRDLAPVYHDGQVTVGRLGHLLIRILQKEFDYRHNAFFFHVQIQIGPILHPGAEVEQVVHDMMTDFCEREIGKKNKISREKRWFDQ